MNCASIQPLLSSWMDQELSGDQVLEVQQHLRDCPKCHALLDDMKRLDQKLRSDLSPTPEEVRQVISGTMQALKSDGSINQHKPWRVIALAVVSAAAGFLLAVLLLPELARKPVASEDNPASSHSENELPIQLALAIGLVEVEVEGHWKPLATGSKLKMGQRLRTPGRSRCELRCKDGSEIRLNHESEIIVHSPRLFHLKQGQVWSTVATAPMPFQIKTDQSTVTALGTQFDLNHQEQRTTLSVLEGKTRINLDGKVADVKAGQQLSLNNKSGVFDISDPSRDYALYQATNWVNEILILKGKDNPELIRRIHDVMASIGETKMSFLAEDEIRTLGDHCVVPLCRYLQSERSQQHGSRREMAARIIADLAQPGSISDMIELLSDANPRVRASVARGLSRLTGQTMNFSEEQWKNGGAQQRQHAEMQWKTWWINNQARYPEILPAGKK